MQMIFSIIFMDTSKQSYAFDLNSLTSTLTTKLYIVDYKTLKPEKKPGEMLDTSKRTIDLFNVRKIKIYINENTIALEKIHRFLLV